MEVIAEYSHAIASVVIFTLITLLVSPMSAMAKQNKGLAPGATPDQDYGDKAYRLNRAYLNCTETLPAFLAVVVLAVLVGANAFWINLLASLALVFRVLQLFVHVQGIGRPNMGVRSFAYVGGWAAMMIMGIMALVAVL